MVQRIEPGLMAVLLLWSLLLCAPLAARDEIAVIVAKEGTEVRFNRKQLHDIYLKKILLAPDGTKLIPVNLPPEHPLRLSLSETLLHKNAQQLQDYWNQRYFHGITPPYVLHSQEAVVQFVAKTPGAIGYISICHMDDRVREVLRLSAPASRRRAVEDLCRVNPEH
jgi:ABC-type phosphate transport system substrate-binding protein